MHSPGGWIFGQATWIVALGCLAVPVATCETSPLPGAAKALAAAPLAFTGRVSYSIYLYHLPLLLLVNAFAPLVQRSWLILPLYLAAVFAVAWLSYRYVEARDRDPTSNAVKIASTWRAATPQSTWVKRPASMSRPNTIGAIASPVSMPEYTKP